MGTTYNLADVMGMTPEEMPEQFLLPEGTYNFQILSYKGKEVGQNKTPIVSVKVRAVEAIDAEVANDISLAAPIYMDFFLTEAWLANVNPAKSIRAFMRDVMELGNLPLAQLLETSLGANFKGIIKHEMQGKDKDRKAAVVSRILT